MVSTNLSAITIIRSTRAVMEIRMYTMIHYMISKFGMFRIWNLPSTKSRVPSVEVTICVLDWERMVETNGNSKPQKLNTVDDLDHRTESVVGQFTVRRPRCLVLTLKYHVHRASTTREA